jgi:hypothetical protein
MTHFSDDDEKLVDFLKEYRPAPPPTMRDLEWQLMELVTRELPLPPKYPHQFFLIISSAMAGSLLLLVGSYRWLKPLPEVASDREELEIFLVDNWNETMSDTSVAFPTTHTTEPDWSLIAEPEARYLVSHP